MAIEQMRADPRAVNSEAQKAATRPSPNENLFVPVIGLPSHRPVQFMEWSSCSAADFLAEEFPRICAELARPAVFHRKIWEWVFITHHLRRLRLLEPGKRGLGFGVGGESMPSLFAKLGVQVVATDAPPEVGASGGWNTAGQFAGTLEKIHEASIIDRETFAHRVTYETCDMANIDARFTGFDFCWSSCCFEHLGSLEAGLDFVVNSVEKTLKVGGIACHTTELNLSSDVETLDSGPTVIYRKQDFKRLIERLQDRGHTVDPFKVAPDHHPLDFYVDLPPYADSPHLRLKLAEFTSTSAGLVVRRGK